MKKLVVICSTLCGTSLLFACASQPPTPMLAFKPVLNVTKDGTTPESYYQLGRYYHGQDRLEQAADAYRKALALDGGLVDAHNRLGAVYAAQGKLDDAVKEFQAVLVTRPTTGYAWNNLGYAYLLQHKLPEATAAFERATFFDPGNERAWNNFGMVLSERGDALAAQAAFAHATDIASAIQAVPGSAMPASTGSPAANNDAGNADAAAVTTASLHMSPEVVAFTPQSPGAEVAVVHPTPTSHLVQVGTSVYELRSASAPMPRAEAAEVKAAQYTFRLELANGNGVPGMARRLGELLAAKGLPHARLTNEKPFLQRVTEIQYRAGYATMAESLQRRMPNQPRLVLASMNDRSDVRVVLGKDLPHNIALLDEVHDEQLAAISPDRLPPQ